MEADVVVNFLDFFINVEEEDISDVLEELRLAGVERNSIDQMFEHLLPGCNCNDPIINNEQEDD